MFPSVANPFHIQVYDPTTDKLFCELNNAGLSAPNELDYLFIYFCVWLNY